MTEKDEEDKNTNEEIDILKNILSKESRAKDVHIGESNGSKDLSKLPSLDSAPIQSPSASNTK